MNKSYRSIGNKSLGAKGAASVIVSSCGEKSRVGRIALIGTGLLLGLASAQADVVVDSGFVEAGPGKIGTVCSSPNGATSYTCTVARAGGGFATLSGVPKVGSGANAGPDTAVINTWLAGNLGENAIALGTLQTSASGANAVAVGANAKANEANSVALGSNSTTAPAVATTGTTINGKAYVFAGTTPKSTVSVGSVGDERTITNVAAGRISPTSTDAINGSQLNATNQAITGLGSAMNSVGNSIANVDNRVTAVDDRVTAVDSRVNNTDNRVTNLGNSTATNLGGGATFNTTTGAVNPPIYKVYGATTNNVGDAVTNLQTKAPVQYSNGAGVSNGNTQQTNDVTLVGATAAPVTIHNVAPGVAPSDAVNVQQLQGGLAGANAYTDNRVNQLQNDLAGDKKDVNAGVAGAMAMAAMPQAYTPGKSLVSAGVASYQGQSALAVGVSKLSDNGQWIMKFSGSATSRGKVGVAAGAGFQW